MYSAPPHVAASLARARTNISEATSRMRGSLVSSKSMLPNKLPIGLRYILSCFTPPRFSGGVENCLENDRPLVFAGFAGR